MAHILIKKLYTEMPSANLSDVTVNGWVRTMRESKSFAFVELNDGSYFRNLQVVLEADKLPNYRELTKQITLGAAVEFTGTLVLTPDMKQPFELKAESVTVVGESPVDYPLQKKRHTLEYLRTIQHLRPRANLFQCAFRVRSAAAQAIHRFFHDKGYLYVHTPLITGSDCEGAGEMFRVTTLDPDALPMTEDGKVDFSKDFFGKARLPHRLRPAERRDLRSGLPQRLHLRPDLPRRSLLHPPPRRRVLDDRAGNCLRRRLKEDMDLQEEMVKYIINRRAARVPGGDEFPEQLRGQGPDRTPERSSATANSSAAATPRPSKS